MVKGGAICPFCGRRHTRGSKVRECGKKAGRQARKWNKEGTMYK